MTATLTPNPKQQFFDANGNPLVGGKLYSYQAGTSTPLATYVDQAATTTNANPIILDSRGEANVWLGTTAYKLALYTATDVLVWTVDNISAADALALADLSQADGSSLVGYMPSGTGAVATTVQAKLRQTVSVKDFGAAGDGVTNDTAAIQAAATVLNSGTLYFPPGNYIVASTITLPYGVQLLGAGPLSTKITTAFAGASTPVFSQNGSAASSATYLCHSGFSVFGNGLGQAFQLVQMAYFQFNNVQTYGFTLHWNLVDCLSCQFVSVRSLSGVLGLWARIGSVSAPNAFTFIGCTFGAINTTALQFDGGSALNYIGGSIEGCGGVSNAPVLLNAPGSNGALAANFDGVYFENNISQADILIVANTTATLPCRVNIRSLFNRISNTRYTTNNVYVSQGASDAPIVVDVSGSAFNGFNTYAPSAGRPYVNFTAALGNAQLIETGATYGSATEAPTVNASAPTLSSAGVNVTIAPKKRITFVSGTGSIQTITRPTNLYSWDGQIVLIPTAAWTLVNTGNIAIAATAVVGRAMVLTYDATIGVWYPSY